MTLNDRVVAYSAAFPKYPVMTVDKGWLMGVWVLGNLYKKASNYYGAYPGNYLKRVHALFPDKPRPLHLFSGTVQHGIAVDINPTLHPTVAADCRALPFVEGAFDWVVADPPYSAKDAENYCTPMIARGPVVKEIRRVMQRGGYLCWLDTGRPMYSKLQWKQVGAVMVLVSTNTRARCLSIFEAV